MSEQSSIVERLRALLNRSTPGEWRVGGPYPGISVCVELDAGTLHEPPYWETVAVLSHHTQGEPSAQAKADAALIVSLRNEAPALLSRVEALEAALSESTSAKLDFNRPDDCLRWALMSLHLVENKLLSLGRTDDTELHNLRAGIQSISDARQAARRVMDSEGE